MVNRKQCRYFQKSKDTRQHWNSKGDTLRRIYSTQKIFCSAGRNHSSLQTIFEEDFQLFLYKIQTYQHLNKASTENIRKFANAIADVTDNSNTRIYVIGDKALFWLSGYMTKQNIQIWGAYSLWNSLSSSSQGFCFDNTAHKIS